MTSEHLQAKSNQLKLTELDAASASEPLPELIAESRVFPGETESPPDLGPRYDILGLVGTGGMGTVWKVHDKELGEDFAIKVLKPELVTDETALKRFQKEANLASELTHANIAAIFGPGEDGSGRPYIIMRYVDGESLADILKREGKLSEERAMDIFSQLCEALSHSHMKGIVHRDIKPSNIIISKTESGADLVQLVDFGIARCVYDEVTKTQALTKAVDVFGSPRYMSPEQLLGEEVTAQSDIYSLGVVLYEMLTGAPPYTNENPVQLIMNQIDREPDYFAISPQLRPILEQCLAKTPTKRASDINLPLTWIKHSREQPLLTINSKDYFELFSFMTSVGVVMIPTMFSSLAHDYFSGVIGFFAILLAGALAQADNFRKLENPMSEQIERIFFASGSSLILFTLPIFILNISKLSLSNTFAWHLSLSVSLGIFAAILSIKLQESEKLYRWYKKEFSNSKSRIISSSRKVRAIKTGAILLVILLLSLPAFLVALPISLGVLCQAPIIKYIFDYKSYVGDALAIALYLGATVWFFLQALRKLSTLSFLPGPTQTCKMFTSIVFLIVLSTLTSLHLKSNTGIIDYVKVAARNFNDDILPKENLVPIKPTHPATHLGALAILGAREAHTNISQEKECYDEIVRRNPDPLLKAAAALKLLNPNAFNRMNTLPDPAYKNNQSNVETVLSNLRLARQSPSRVENKSLTLQILKNLALALPTYSEGIILDNLSTVANSNLDSSTLRRIVAYLETLPFEDRCLNAGTLRTEADSLDNFIWHNSAQSKEIRGQMVTYH